jgi:valyl-tRNA synthetase
MTVTDRWILSRLAQTIAETTEALNEYKYSEPLSGLYRFFWNDFCDWYLEWVKPRMKDKSQKPIAQNILAFVLDQILRLLHPFVPFITEGIFQKLNEVAPLRQLKGLAEAKISEALVITEWPQKLDSLRDGDTEKQIMIIQNAVRTIRDIRSKYNKPPSEMLKASAKSQQQIADILNRNAELIEQLASVKEFQAGTATAKPANAAVAIVDATEIYVHDAINLQAERRRLKKQKQQIEKAKTSIEAKLANKNFLQKAKPQVVAQAKDKLIQLSKELEIVEKHLAELENSE